MQKCLNKNLSISFFFFQGLETLTSPFLAFLQRVGNKKLLLLLPKPTLTTKPSVQFATIKIMLFSFSNPLTRDVLNRRTGTT